MAKFRLIAAAVAILGAVLAVLPTDPELAPATGANTLHEAPASIDAAHAALADAATGETVAPTRTTIPANVPIEPWLDHPFEFELRMIEMARDGLPSSGQTLRLGLSGTHCDAYRVTDDDGLTTVQWRSRRADGTAIVRDGRGTLHAVTMRHGVPSMYSVRGEATGREFRGWMSIGNGVVLPTRPLAPGLHPFAVFGDDIALTEDADALLTLTLGRWRPSRFPPPPDPRTILVDADAPTVSGTVVDANGEGVANADVALLDRSPQPLARTTTDDAGRYTLQLPSQGTFVVHADGAAAGSGTTPVDTHRDSLVANVLLHRTRVLRGRVVRTDDAPCEVEWRTKDESWCRATTVANDGTFALADLPQMPGRLLVWVGAEQIPVATSDLHGGAHSVEVNVPPHASRIVMRFDQAGGEGWTRMDVRAWQSASGLGSSATCDADSWSFAKLARGWYHLEAIASGSGHVDLGVHWVDGEHELDLGRVPLPRPARVRFAMEEGETCELYSIRDDADVHVPLGPSNEATVSLPAGDYALAVADRAGNVRFVRFTARSGEETVVTAQ